MSSQGSTTTQILDVAEHLIQVRGYNAFSYADIATQVGIKKASIHYYFPNKDALGEEVVRRYRADLQIRLAQIDQQTTDARHKLTLYVQLYVDIIRDPEQLCLCGMLAADVLTLPTKIRAEVQGFFADNEAWLTAVLTQGVQNGELQVIGSAEREAQALVAGLQGALLVSRAFSDVSRFHLVAQQLLQQIK